MYGAFKKELAEAVLSVIEPLQQRYRDIRESGELTRVLSQSAERAQEAAERTLTEVRHRMGFLPR
ncbi:Tryptophan--tRNA ligase [compost metagenome]